MEGYSEEHIADSTCTCTVDDLQINMESTTAAETKSCNNKSVDDDECPSSSSKDGIENYETDSSSCTSSCSTRRNSFIESDFEITFNTLFRTPSSTTTSHTSGINSPIISGRSSNVLEGIDSLLQRITSERFTELRNIQLSERPVTSGNARGNIETFFRRAVHGLTEEERHLEEEAIRPTHVLNDVQLLQQQSLVRSSLQNNFRDILERTLLSRLSTPDASPQPIQNVTHRRRNLVGGVDFRARLESLYGGRSTGSAGPRAVRTSNSAPQQNISARPTTYQSTPPPPPVYRSTPAPPPPAYRSTPAPPPPAYRSTPAPPPLAPITNGEEATANFGITIDAGLEILAQNIADDLNRLESLQVVSSMLRGDFRNDLESMVQQRISNESTGNRTQQFIRSLPGRRTTTQSTYPQSQASINAGVTAELGSLKVQMDEMKRMLAMSMEIQMDTQRAIRQEVSAIFSTFMQDYLIPRAVASPSTQPTVHHPPITTPVATGQCVICVDRSVDTVLYQCGHMCVCNHCGLQLKMDGHNCPMCRAPIRDVIRAYQTQ